MCIPTFWVHNSSAALNYKHYKHTLGDVHVSRAPASLPSSCDFGRLCVYRKPLCNRLVAWLSSLSYFIEQLVGHYARSTDFTCLQGQCLKHCCMKRQDYTNGTYVSKCSSLVAIFSFRSDLTDNWQLLLYFYSRWKSTCFSIVSPSMMVQGIRPTVIVNTRLLRYCLRVGDLGNTVSSFKSLEHFAFSFACLTHTSTLCLSVSPSRSLSHTMLKTKTLQCLS